MLYAGDNDLALGRTPERVLGDYRAFVARLRSAWPAARLAFVSIKPSPSRRAYIDRMRLTNQRIRAGYLWARAPRAGRALTRTW